MLVQGPSLKQVVGEASLRDSDEVWRFVDAHGRTRLDAEGVPPHLFHVAQAQLQQVGAFIGRPPVPFGPILSGVLSRHAHSPSLSPTP